MVELHRASATIPCTNKPQTFRAEEPEEEESGGTSEAESESDTITQQPKSCAGASVKQNIIQDEGVLTEDGTNVSSRCDTVKACLMKVPCAPFCLNRVNQLLKQNNITLPQVAPVPKLPSHISQVTQQFSSLPTRLNQLPQRITRIPQQISQRVPKLPEHFPSLPRKLPSFPERFSSSFPHGLPKIPQTLPDFSKHFSNFPQRLSNIPHHLSNLPQHLTSVPRQCYKTVQNRLSSIRPQNNA
ncbi:cyclic nucleotide-gated cation channel beta-1-like [Clarias magur]|uniref:Cyclic nucleotide-gated cation channel beta-1-like n=1 Tax=Clarias magur TaxID=1594786 RepID=A0A8J4UHG5_CLAMG|nr:cyclic nucleotide-gated cation channel beta-1-like [Clarias magur]